MSLDNQLKEVYAFIDSHRDSWVEELRHFLRLPSISAQGVGLEECADFLKEIMVHSGIEAKLCPIDIGPPVVYGELKSPNSQKTLICYGHYDVQPPEPLEEWVSPPFAAEIKNGIIYARGATDDKSGVMAFIKAAEAFLKTDRGAPVNLKFVFEGEEEIGSVHLEDWLEGNKDMLKGDGLHCLDGGLVPGTGRPRLDLILKAMLKLELTARGPDRDVHSMMAGMVVNPAWRLVLALASLKDQNDRILVDGWYDEVQSPSEEAINYLREEAEMMDEGKVKETLGVKEFLLGRSGVELLKERYFGATASINGLLAGYTGKGSKTIIPKVAMAKLDFRCPPNMDPAVQLEKIKKHLVKHGFGDIEINAHVRRFPWLTPINSGISQAIMKASTTVFGKPPAVHGCTAEAFFRHYLDVPCALTGFGPEKDNCHAPNENMPIDDFMRGIKYEATIMQEFASTS